MTRTGRLLALILLLLTVGCDRVTKHFATTRLAGNPDQSLLGDTLRLEYAENTGGFLSFGSSLPKPIRIAIFSVGVGALLTMLALVAWRDKWSGLLLWGASLAWAGGVSNLIDRLAQGRVVDFLNVGVGSIRTGIFNVADVAVLIGLALIAVARTASPSENA